MCKNVINVCNVGIPKYMELYLNDVHYTSQVASPMLTTAAIIFFFTSQTVWLSINGNLKKETLHIFNRTHILSPQNLAWYWSILNILINWVTMLNGHKSLLWSNWFLRRLFTCLLSPAVYDKYKDDKSE